MNVQKIPSHDDFKNWLEMEILLSFPPYFVGDGGDEDNLDRGCLRGLCEREMIKVREFLLISEVSAVPPSSCSDDNDYSCHGDCDAISERLIFSWRCLEFYSGCNDVLVREMAMTE